MKRTGAFLAGLCLAFALALGACGGASEGRGEGIVRGVDPEKGQITIEHGDIPGLMKAMTMTFEVSEPGLLGGIEPGDAVVFEVRYADGTYSVTRVTER